MNKKLPSLTFAIPAYNEEDNIDWVLRNTVTNAPKYLADFEIVVIDDGSTDKTGIIADSFAKKNKLVRVIHQENKGYGEAMLRGIYEARKDYVAYLAADGQFLVEDMRYCLPLMKEADLVLGARGSRADYSVYRLILSYTYLIILRIMFSISYQDVNWLNIWSTKKIKNIDINSRGVFLLAEIVIKFQRKGYSIIEGPSFYRARRGGKEKNSKLSIALKTFLDACFLWFKFQFK